MLAWTYVASRTKNRHMSTFSLQNRSSYRFFITCRTCLNWKTGKPTVILFLLRVFMFCCSFQTFGLPITAFHQLRVCEVRRRKRRVERHLITSAQFMLLLQDMLMIIIRLIRSTRGYFDRLGPFTVLYLLIDSRVLTVIRGRAWQVAS